MVYSALRSLGRHDVLKRVIGSYRCSTTSSSFVTTPNLLRLNRLPPTGTMTKVVCTLGPSTDVSSQVGHLVDEGMHVARLNFSHGGSDYTYPSACMQLVRGARGKHFNLSTDSSSTTKNLRAILVDTKGPEIRTGPLESNQDVVEIGAGDEVELTIHDVSNDTPTPEKHRIHVDYKSIAKSVDIGGHILLDDGLIALEVTAIDPKLEYVTCSAMNGGPIKRNKGVNLPGVELDLPALTEKDKADLTWSCEVGADFVAASFIRTAANVRSVVAFLDRCIAQMPLDETGKLPLRPLVISKIESKEGVDNFVDILRESDGIMVARGDLGVEVRSKLFVLGQSPWTHTLLKIPYSKVFAAQKMMVSACNEVGKPVIVATQMLDSMIRNPRPTRAEVTDVGTAVLDGADAVMLSGETAAGKYPIESLKAMASVVWEADQILNTKQDLFWSQELHDSMSPQEQELDAVAASACKSAMRMGAKTIVVISMSGRVARAVARHRPGVPVLAFCTDAQAARRLQLHRAITPIMLQSKLDPGSSQTRMGVLRAEAVRTAKELGYVSSGDRIIMVDRTVGKSHDLHEFSHNMKVVTLM